MNVEQEIRQIKEQLKELSESKMKETDYDTMDAFIDWVDEQIEKKKKRPFLENIFHLSNLPHRNSNVRFLNWNHNWRFPRLGVKVRRRGQHGSKRTTGYI